MEWKDRLQLFSSLRNAKILGSNARRRQALAGISIIGGKMQNTLLKLLIKYQNLINDERGQDLVEYALLCSLIALSLIAGIKNIASAVNTVFSNVSSSLS